MNLEEKQDFSADKFGMFLYVRVGNSYISFCVNNLINTNVYDIIIRRCRRNNLLTNYYCKDYEFWPKFWH